MTNRVIEESAPKIWWNSVNWVDGTKRNEKEEGIDHKNSYTLEVVFLGLYGKSWKLLQAEIINFRPWFCLCELSIWLRMGIHTATFKIPKKVFFEGLVEHPNVYVYVYVCVCVCMCVCVCVYIYIYIYICCFEFILLKNQIWSYLEVRSLSLSLFFSYSC